VPQESIDMSTFLSICLYIFAACAALGLLPAAVLAAKARQPVMIVVSLVVATFVVFVLVAAAGELPRH
jgi:spore maturation protein SpmA